MILLLFGPPGSGKGTQSRLLSQWLRIPALSTGDLLRAEAASGTDLGRLLSEILRQGRYVSDDMVNQIVLNHLAQLDGGGLILDGYPRTVEQAEFLERELRYRQLPLPVAVTLGVPTEVIVERLTSRRTCNACRKVFHLAEVCDECSAPLVVRSDDEPATVRKRLQTYAAVTRPVLEHFRGARSVAIDGDQPPEVVFSLIQQALGDPALGAQVSPMRQMPHGKQL